MNKEILEITDIADLKNISVDYLEAKYGYKAFKGEQVTRVNSSPKIIYYGKGKFVGSFLFGQNGLRRIILCDFTRENFSEAINNSTFDESYKDLMMSQLENYYNDCADPESIGHSGDHYTDNAQTADGVAAGIIAPMFQKDDGGATQYYIETPSKEWCSKAN